MLTLIPPVDPSWTIVQIVENTAPTSWKACFLHALPEFKHVSKKLDDEQVFGSYLPLKRDLFNAFKYTALEDVKVILLDYEPSNIFVTINGKNVPRDVGLAYSVRTTDTMPRYFDNIIKLLSQSVKNYPIPNHGSLVRWAQQGVLLLHYALTTSLNQSHAEYELWHGVLNKVFKAIAAVNPGCIAMLWGRKIQCVNKLLPNSFEKIETAHPMDYNDQFLESDCFNKVNALLVKQNKTPIVW